VRLILRFILVVFILIIFGVTALLFMPGDRIAKFAEDQFEAATGRSMDITGDVRTSIYPLLGVRTGPVTIANADWAGGEPMLSADGLSIGVNLMALFKGDVKIKKVEVIAPQILLEVAKDGRANWEMAPAGDSTSAGPASGGGAIPAFTLGRGLVQGGKLTYINHASGEKTVLSDLDIDLRLPDFTGQGDISLSMRMHGQPISLDTTVVNFGKFINGGVSALETSIKTGGSSIAFNGKAGISPFAADGKVDADLAALKAVDCKTVAVCIIDKHAFLAALADGVIPHFAFIGLVHHNAVVAVIEGQITLDQHIVGIHNRIAEVVTLGNITGNHRVVGIHIVHGKTQVPKAVADEFVVARGVDKHAVAAKADIVADDAGAGGVPDIDAVATVVHALVLAAFDSVVGDQ
jgi:hypothetical protein